MSFAIGRGVRGEQVEGGYLILRPSTDAVLHLQGRQAEAFELARAGARDVPEHLNEAMAGLVELGVVATDTWSRRTVLQLGGAAAAGAVAVIALPSIAAAASHATTLPPATTVPDPNPCVLFDWGPRSSAPLSAGGTGNNSNVQPGTDSTNTVVNHVTATDAVVGSSPPVINGTWGGSAYRNFWVHNTAVSGYGTVSGYGDGATQAGLILIQNNSGASGGTPNPVVSNITNYQEVTFTFDSPVTSLTFTVYDLSANAVVGASNGYMDAVGFSAAPTVVGDTGSGRTVGGQLVGSGTFADPFRRVLTTDNYWGADPNDPDHNIPLDVTVRFTGPLTELKMRYSSIAGPAMQFIKIGDMQAGGGCAALPPGA